MNSAKLSEKVEETNEKIKSKLGNLSALGITTGTGWSDGVNNIFHTEEEIPYKELGIPGSELEVKGHEKTLKAGYIKIAEGIRRNVLVLGRVHPNENITHPDLRQAMAVLIGGLREHLEGLIITNGVGTLHGRVGLEKGQLHSLVRTAMLDVLGWMHRGRRKTPINVGDIALVDDVKTSLVGSLTPLGAGEFIDFYHNGIHRDKDFYFKIAHEAIEAAQGKCPIAQSRFIAGPHFEGPSDKIEFRAKGDDVIGMSGIQEIFSCVRNDIAFAQVILATNGPFGTHSHEGNQEAGKGNTKKAEMVLRNLIKNWPRKK